MKRLTRIRLINWHYLVNHTIDVEGSLYIFGKNESGKSSVLDALQFVLVADLRRVRFNASAQEEAGRSGRDLASYVRGKVGETWLREAATGYVVLEFVEESGSAFLVGVVVDARADGPTDQAFFICNESRLEDSLFLDERSHPYSRREFAARLRSVRGAKVYPAIEEYQEALLNRFGQINNRFFDLFVKAFAFRPVSQIREFVYDYLLDYAPVDVNAMRRTREQLEEFQALVDRVEAQIDLLQQMMEAEGRRAAAARTLRLHEYLILSARREAADRLLTGNQARQTELATRLAELTGRLQATTQQTAVVQETLDAATAALNADARWTQRQALERECDRLRAAVREAQGVRTALAGAITNEARRLGAWWPQRPEGTTPIPDSTPVITFLHWAGELPAALEDLTRAEAVLATARDTLTAINTWAREERAAVQGPLAETRERARAVEAELAIVRAGGPLTPPPEAERLRTLLTPILGTPPPYIYPALDVTEARWQTAIEGALGRRRFDMLIPPEHLAACVTAYEATGGREVHNVRLVDTGALTDPPAPLPAASLARYLTTPDPLVQKYVNQLFADLIACETAEAALQQARAITPAGLLVEGAAVDHLDPEVAGNWFIGASARSRRIERLEAEQAMLAARLADFTQALAGWESAIRATSTELFAGWLARLPALAEGTQQAATLTNVERQLTETDWTGLAVQEARIARLRAERETLHTEELRLSTEAGAIRQEAAMVQAQESALAAAATEHAEVLARAEAAEDPAWVREAQIRYTAERRQYDPDRVIEVFSSQRQGYEKRMQSAQNEIRERQADYHRQYAIQASINEAVLEPYRDTLARLEASELPTYRQQVEQARRDAEVEFREHFLHRLRDQIRTAQARLDEMNEALKPIDFSGTRYRFLSEPNQEYRTFYDLIVRSDSERLGLPLLEGAFYEEHKAVIDELFEKLALPHAGLPDAEVERLRDYRSYLTYDIELIQDDGRRERFSRVGRLQSGGKTQAPYYVAMVAAFAQLYRVADPQRNNTVRLIVFDEAFNRMDRDNTASALEMMRRYGLQVITATPPKKFDEIAPYVQTCLFLARTGDRVIVTPYYRDGAAG